MEEIDVYQYPEGGFDLTNEKQRETAYRTLYSVFRYISSKAKIRPTRKEINTEVLSVKRNF